jgi:hypothetical protein
VSGAESAEIVRAHCNTCGGPRNCFVRASYSKHGADEEAPINWCDTYRVVECCGCGEVAVQHDYWFSEDTDHRRNPATGEWEEVPNVRTTYYPPAVFRRLPPWHDVLSSFDTVLGEVLTEVYGSLQADAVITATAGARILLDRAMVLLVGDIGGFDRKLSAMVEKGIIGLEDRALLDAMTDAGSAASHRGYRPSREHLATIIDTVENLLHRKFVLQQQAAEVKQATPRRRPSQE